MGLNDAVFAYKDNQLRSFLFDWTQTNRDYRLYNFLCFEMLLATKHGRTKCYIDVDGVYEPELHEETATDYHWMVDAHHEAAQKYAQYVTRLLDFKDLPEGASQLCCQLMRQFISAPALDESRAYGDNLIASEIREEDMQKMAPELSYSGFLRYWPQASFVRSGLNMVNRGYGVFLDMRLLDIYRKYFLKY